VNVILPGLLCPGNLLWQKKKIRKKGAHASPAKCTAQRFGGIGKMK
jgi:hypothetical protein